MKITIRREELRQVLSGYFRTEVEDFTIVANNPSQLGEILRSSVPDPLDKSKKVSNVVSLKRTTERLKLKINLTESKWAILNWQTFIDFVDEYNRLPVQGYGCGAENEGKLR